MANHYRKQIRDAIKAKLSVPSLASVLAANVITEDDYEKDSTQMPCIVIGIGDSSRERKGTVNAGGGVQRIEVENIVTVTLDCLVMQSTGLRDMLDQIACEVEARWLATPADKGLGIAGCRDSELIYIAAPVIDTDGDTPAGSQRMQFQVKVRSFEGAPDLT